MTATEPALCSDLLKYKCLVDLGVVRCAGWRRRTAVGVHVADRPLVVEFFGVAGGGDVGALLALRQAPGLGVADVCDSQESGGALFEVLLQDLVQQRVTPLRRQALSHHADLKLVGIVAHEDEGLADGQRDVVYSN